MNIRRIISATICIMLIFTACGTKAAEEKTIDNTIDNTNDIPIKVTEEKPSESFLQTLDIHSKTESEKSETSSKTISDTKERTRSDYGKASSSNKAVSSKPSETEDKDTTSDESVYPEEDTANEETVTEQESEKYAAGLYCIEDGKYLYEERTAEKFAPASLTKLLTASVALKYLSEEEIIEVGTEQNLVNYGSSVCYINIGNRMTVRELLYGMLLSSGNDAAYTAAVCTARKAVPEAQLDDNQAVEKFCEMMNDFAQSIGMENSQFVTPDGWDNAEQYTTVSDLVKLSEYVMTVPLLREITGTYQHYAEFETGESMTWTNTNRLLDPNDEYYRENAVGLKTGTTANAGCCLAAAFTEGERTYISVVLGCNDTNERYNRTVKMIEEYNVQ